MQCPISRSFRKNRPAYDSIRQTGVIFAVILALSVITVISRRVNAQSATNCTARYMVVFNHQANSTLPCSTETITTTLNVVNDFDPFPTPAPPVDVTFGGGSTYGWGNACCGGSGYGTTRDVSGNPCGPTQITLQFSQPMMSVWLHIQNPTGSSALFTMTANTGQTYSFNPSQPGTYNGAGVVEGQGITSVTISSPNVPFSLYSISFWPDCQVTSVDWVQIDGPLDNNPSIGAGSRIFPDKPTAPGAVRSKVRVRATSNVGAGKTVYFKSFDVDDPSTDAAPVDANGAAGNDNRGTPNSGTLTPVGGSGSSNTLSATTDTSGVAQVDFIVTMRPGDNFVVAAALDQTYLNGVVVNGIGLSDSANAPLPTIRAKANPMLTVWRRVHIEVDSMGLVTGNSATGRTNTVTPNTGTNTTVVAAGNGLESNRFQNGRMVLTNVGSYSVVSNTANTVTVQGIINSVPHNTNYTLYDDDDFNNNNATTLIGDIGENVSAPDTSLIQDSDNPALNVFAAAYVRPTYDIGDNNDLVAFKLNMDTTSATTIIANYDFDTSATQADVNFWTVYLLGAYQGRTTEDHDPATDSALVGIVDNLNGQGANVFIEVIRPPETTNTGVVNNAATTAHEIGHLFNGQHTDGSGLMAQSINRASITFDPTTLNTIRSITHP
jgi:hypothetical protein